MTPLYIIPARGGSKGIPRKNIKPLHGRPLIAYTVDVAMKCAARGGYILLSTDSDEIANVGRRLGLTVDYMRPAALATDSSGSREMMIDAMDWADAHGVEYDCVVLLQPTSPLRNVSDVNGAIELYDDSIDMVVSVCQTDANPYYNCFETDADGFLHVSKGDGLLTRRQDAPAAWEYNGAVYVINPVSLRRSPLGGFSRRVPFEMPKERSVDIDSPLDWMLAECIMAQTDKDC